MSSRKNSGGSLRPLDLERGKKLLQEWLSLKEEERTEILRQFLRDMKKTYEEDKAKAIRNLIAWLMSEDGAVMLPWFFKKEYRQDMVDLVYALLKLTTYSILSFGGKNIPRK